MKYFSQPDYVTRNLFGQLGNKDYAITNLNPSLIIYAIDLIDNRGYFKNLITSH